MALLMIHLSTLPSGLFPAEDIQEEITGTLSNEDQLFLYSLREKLDEAIKDPQPETISRILEYSSGFKTTD